MGNLLSRISSPKLQKRFIAAVDDAKSTVIEPAEEDAKIAEMLGSIRDRMEVRMKKLEVSRALEEVMDLVFEVGGVTARNTTCLVQDAEIGSCTRPTNF
jgi:methionyl-tRNA synthetase